MSSVNSTSPSSARIRHLYSKFRSRSSNPEGFDAKLNYWIQTINDWCINKRQFKFTIQELRKSLRHDNLLPDTDALRLVCTEMKRRSNLATKDVFVNQVCRERGGDGGWISWGLGSLTKPLKIGLSLFGGAVGGQGEEMEEIEMIDENISPESELVNVDAVTSGCKSLIQLLSDNGMIDKCLKYEEFEKFINNKWKTASHQLETLLLYLTSTKQVVQMEDKGTKYIKFGDNVKFSEVDISLRRLEAARELVEEDIVKIEIEMDKCREEAKMALRESNRTKAKSLLRRKKRLEDVLGKKEAQLDNIHYLSEQLVDVSSNKMVVNAYKECADALKAAQSKHDDLTTTIANVEEAFEYHNELISDLGRTMSSTLIDDEDLEAELKEFLEEEEEEIEVPQPPKSKVASAKVTDDKIDELYARLENLRRPMGQASPTNGPGARKVKKIIDD